MQMSHDRLRIITLVLAILAAFSAQALASELVRPVKTIELAQAVDPNAEKDAFESAKELGTVEAWDAYLSNYPAGFRADLARAYVKKLADGPSPTPAAAAPPPPPSAPVMMQPSISRLSLAPPPRSVDDDAVAARIDCSLRGSMRSQISDNPSKITFINYLNEPIEVYWINADGGQQLFGEIKTDRQATVNTFYGHPWLVTNLQGECLHIAVPNPGVQVYVIGGASNVPPARVNTTSCDGGRIKIDGKCIRKQDAVGFCGPGYRPEGGKCVQGYVAPKQVINNNPRPTPPAKKIQHPWDTPKCKAIMSKCNNGANPAACQQHEAQCTYND